MSDERDANDPSSPDVHRSTRVDLGDDLLQEKTVVLPANPLGDPATGVQANLLLTEESAQGKQGTESVSDLLESAKILVNEGFVEDAKKTLRQILILEPAHVGARQFLAKIQKQELEQIIEDKEVYRPALRKDPVQLVEPDDVETVLRQLDQDLQLGIISDHTGIQVSSQLSLFESPELLDEFCVQLEKTLVGSSAQDWIDLGIGFLEMEFYSIAIRLFTGACQAHARDKDLKLSANTLLAFSLILAGRPFEATTKIQPMLYDSDLKEENKVELFYLMGRIYELMKKFELTLDFYHQVIAIDPYYRDVDLRAKRIGKLNSKYKV